MATVEYTIISGEAPFTAELTPSLVPVNIHTIPGTYNFINVPDGGYTLSITDSNGCIYQKELNINQFVSTTTTTIIPGSSIVVGNVQDESLIFNIKGTNNFNHYGENSIDTVFTLYLWLKTLDGLPLTTQKTINYKIIATTGLTSGSTFVFNSLSDWIHTNVVEITSGPSKAINGQIVLNVGFIETYFMYTYNKYLTVPDFKITLDSPLDWLYTNIPLIEGLLKYGVTYIDTKNIILNY